MKVDHKEISLETERHSIEVVGFKFGSKSFAIPLNFVREIIHSKPVTCIPKSSPLISGMVAVNGNALPAINLDIITGEEAKVNPKQEKMVSIQFHGKEAVIRVDEVTEVVTLDTAYASHRGEKFIEFILNRGEEQLFVLDLAKIFEEIDEY